MAKKPQSRSLHINNLTSAQCYSLKVCFVRHLAALLSGLFLLHRDVGCATVFSTEQRISDDPDGSVSINLSQTGGLHTTEAAQTRAGIRDIAYSINEMVGAHYRPQCLLLLCRELLAAHGVHVDGITLHGQPKKVSALLQPDSNTQACIDTLAATDKLATCDLSVTFPHAQPPVYSVAVWQAPGEQK